jgi:hypothetical membrane protein
MAKSKNTRNTQAQRAARVGSWLWLSSVQYFMVQGYVARSFVGGFSLRERTISDLGITQCALHGQVYVCSPRFMVMNWSFIALGLTMALGAWLLGRSMAIKGTKLGFLCMAVAGAGTILVGIFPSNVIGLLHGIGAALPFLIGNIGLLVLGRSLTMPATLRYFTYLSGIIALVALGMFVSKTYAGLGIGGMERLVAYPQTIWLIIYGAYYLKVSKHFR